MYLRLLPLLWMEYVPLLMAGALLQPELAAAEAVPPMPLSPTAPLAEASTAAATKVLIPARHALFFAMTRLPLLFGYRR
jgi:hypothetical protein